ncbi:ABC transporter permease [uncultured Jatrophihabitans sp.]|uniref:ABC transporter permease n=1 Tax=uncultured Jatrophihabitans sp. TaxID=1610747 RepID=UPI0035C985CB
MSFVAGSGPVIPTFQQSSCIKNNRVFCWDYFSSHWDSVFKPALLQHIGMTVVAVVIGFVIAFTLAVLAHFANFLVAPVTFFGSLLYTIPSLAAFEVLVPITGINYVTVEIALVAYTLLILFTNTLAGLSGISPEVLDAARGSGLTRSQILMRVELPLALPTIVAGLRVATVTVISLATIAAFSLIPKGLGQPIYDGSQRNINTEFIAAAVMCIALALIADALLAGGQRLLTPWTRRRR